MSEEFKLRASACAAVLVLSVLALNARGDGTFDETAGFTDSKPDLVTYNGTITLPAGLDMSNPHEFDIAIGNIVVNTMIDGKGKGPKPTKLGILKSLKVTSKVKKGHLTTGVETAQIAVTYNAAGLVNSGFDTEGISAASTDVPKGKTAPRKIQVAVLLDGFPFQVVTPVAFSISRGSDFGSVSGRSGK